ncbi:AAA family ATPase [Paenibacillus sp. KN14-4R]|uniref:AAA family ATPase n=1 Tax=Paenibacillus sp. KN14-4R TaxID=3445773 RepID=UPI003F9F1A42
MIEITSYQTIDVISKNGEIAYYRLLRLEDRLSVIAKTTCDEYPGGAIIEAFRYEYDMLTKLDGRGTLEVYGFEIVGSRPVIFMQDIGGSTLDQVVRTHTNNSALGLQSKLKIAAAAADSLMHIHRADIRLNEITPFQLIVNLDTSEVKFVDIRMCSSDTFKYPRHQASNQSDYTLPYISPEQTGRTGLTPDYRSDFYSLGVILYELFAGSLPFEVQDVLDIVYHHLASKPEPLHHRLSSIPLAISNIIDKCLEKIPEDRYASAFGIKSDLEACLAQIQTSGRIESITVASSDSPEHLIIPTHFYGRRLEQQKLLDALERVSNGMAETVRVIGHGGMGKTTFIQYTLQQAIPQDGLYATGKCAIQHAKFPYDVWIQVIEQLMSQILMESKLQMEVWKLRVLEALDGYGQLLIELVPKLELLIGPQVEVQSLPPFEAKHRLHLLLNRFIQLFLHRDRPFVLFFDDLQWADEASLQYLTYLLDDKGTKNLLLILAYRDGEIAPDHPLHQFESHLIKRNLPINSIQLKSLEITDLKQLLSDAMRNNLSGNDEIAKILLDKTGGNPFFLKQLLQDLIDHKQVTFEQTSRIWQWDIEGIAEMNLSDNATGYIADKINYFPSEMRRVLGYAAFLGSQFDLEALVSITGLSVLELSEMIAVAIEERLIQSISKENSTKYKFLHDRIEQAAYRLIPEADRPDIHMTIGSYLTQQLKSGENNTNLFHVVNHLNQALARIHLPAQKMELAELNLQAALKAKQSTAYETSLRYLRGATDLLDEASWGEAYTVTFQIYRERAEAEYLCAHFAEANELFQLLMSKASSNLDKAIVCNMMIQFESSQDNYHEVIALGRQTLELLDIRHQFEPSTFELTLAWLKLRRKIKKHPIESFYQMQPMKDEARKVAMSALVHVGNACYFINQKGWVASSITMIEMTLEYGMTPEASIGFIGYAMFLYFRFHHYEETYKWGMLACQISKPYPHLYVKTLSSFALCCDCWRHDRLHMLQNFSEHAGKVGLESGDLWHGNQSVLINSGILLQFGHSLEDIYDRLIAHSGELLRHNNSLHWKQAVILAALIARLTGYRAPNDPFAATDVHSAEFATSVHGDQFQIIEELVCVLEYLPGYIFGQYTEAHEALKRSGVILNARTDPFENVVQIMYESLVMAQLYAEASAEDQHTYWITLKKNLKMMKKHAMRCPEHYLHKYFLLQAEMARLAGKNPHAEQLYEKSIEAARKYVHIHDLAMAAECFGRYGLGQGKEHLAKIYMTEAYEAYLEWGAKAKAADMEQKYGHLLHIRRESALERVDSLSLIMSTQALSGEVEMNRLLQTLMRIMLHNAGAEYGALIFNHNEKWMVEAHGTVEELHIESVHLKEDSDLVPAAIIGYAARTREEVVLHDAARVGMFARNSFVREKGLKSVLCLPIMHKNQLIGLLYMENKLATRVFTPQRLEVLKLLASQCAISIENAKLYTGIQHLNNSLEDQVKERTRSLELSMRETSAALAEVSVYEERNRIAQEIHDIVGHTLTSTILQIEAGRRLMQRDMEAASIRLKEAQDLVRHSLNEIRGSVHMLKEDKFAALTPMLQQLIRDTERNTGAAIHAHIQDVSGLSNVCKKTIYHALQEGLTNGIRHGGSKQFRFTLETVGSDLQIRLKDRGKGASAIVMGFGLKVMKERVEQIGGSLSIECWPDQGCHLKIDLPYPMRLLGDNL